MGFHCTQAVIGYTVMVRIGESLAALSFDFALNNDSTIFPSTTGGTCSWAFGDNGDNLYPFFIACVTGTAPNRTATVFIYNSAQFLTGTDLYMTLTVKFNASGPLYNITGGSTSSLQNVTNTFPIFGANFPGTTITSSKWPTSSGVTISNNVLTITGNNSSAGITGITAGYGDYIQLVFYGALANSTTSYVGGGFADYLLVNSCNNNPTSTIITNSYSSGTSYNIITKQTGNHLYRISRVATLGIVTIDNSTSYTAAITSQNSTSS